MAAKPDPDLPTPAVVIRVTRSGGVAGIRRGWRIESVEPDGWVPLVDACPWQDEPGSSGADRFVWRIEVRAARLKRRATLPDAFLDGPWLQLVDRVRQSADSG